MLQLANCNCRCSVHSKAVESCFAWILKMQQASTRFEPNALGPIKWAGFDYFWSYCSLQDFMISTERRRETNFSFQRRRTSLKINKIVTFCFWSIRFETFKLVYNFTNDFLQIDDAWPAAAAFSHHRWQAPLKLFNYNFPTRDKKGWTLFAWNVNPNSFLFPQAIYTERFLFKMGELHWGIVIEIVRMLRWARGKTLWGNTCRELSWSGFVLVSLSWILAYTGIMPKKN